MVEQMDGGAGYLFTLAVHKYFIIYGVGGDNESSNSGSDGVLVDLTTGTDSNLKLTTGMGLRVDITGSSTLLLAK